MNKKGFTLIEILAVIVLLGLIGTIAVTSINGVNDNIKKEMLNSKANMIEEAALLYGQNYIGTVKNSSNNYNSNPCINVKVYELVPTYLDKDNDNDCLTSDSTDEGCIVDPSDKNNYLDNYNIIVYYKNNRIKAKLDIDKNLSCS